MGANSAHETFYPLSYKGNVDILHLFDHNKLLLYNNTMGLVHIRRMASEVIRKEPDVLWVIPFVLSVSGAIAAISERNKSPLKTFLHTGMAVSSLIQTAHGFKMASEIESNNKLNKQTATDLNDPNSPLAQKLKKAIEKYQAEHPNS
jgi:hypothetical protein